MQARFELVKKVVNSFEIIPPQTNFLATPHIEQVIILITNCLTTKME